MDTTNIKTFGLPRLESSWCVQESHTTRTILMPFPLLERQRLWATCLDAYLHFALHFLEKEEEEGNIFGRVTETRRYSSDLPQGGLEVPCILEFVGVKNDVDKVCGLAKLSLPSTASTNKSAAELSVTSKSTEPPTKKRKMIHDSIKEEIRRISMGEKLTDVAINWVQQLIKIKFSHIDGFESTLHQQRKTNRPKAIVKGLQIVHCRNDHWILASTVGSQNELLVYDSLYDSVDKECKEVLHSLFPKIMIKMSKCQKQVGYADCGLFAIANATAVAYSTANFQFNHR